MLKDLDVVFGSVAPPLMLVDVVEGPHEGNKLARDDPIQIAILHLFVVLILLVVKLFELVPPKLDSPLKALQAVLDGARVAAVLRVGGVPERDELVMVRLEELPCRCGLHLEHNYHEGAH
jgi:hypothetical protein